jgi:hypothetical protein
VSEPVKVLPMAQLLRLAREKEAREREADAVTTETPAETAAPAVTTPQETIVGWTIPQQTIVEPTSPQGTIVSQTIVRSAKPSRGHKVNALPEVRPAKETRRSQPPPAGAVDVSKGYYPSYNDLSDRLIPELGLNPFEQSVLQRLYRLSRGWKSDECEVGLGTLSKFCVMSRSQVQRSVAALIKKGLIINLGPAKKGSKDGNRYRVLPGVPTVPPQTMVRQTIVPEEGTIPSQNTEVGQTIVTGNTNKNSKFTLEECRRFAESLRGEGIQNPGGYATTIHRSGEADDRVEAFLGRQGGAREEKPALTPEQIQEQANVAASMLQHGSSIEEVEQLLAGNFRPAQWSMIRSVALAQAKVTGASAKTKDSKS